MNNSRAVGWRDWHQKSLATRRAKARTRGEQVLPLIQAWRQDGRSWAQLGEGGGAAGRRRYPGVPWRPLASRPAPQGMGKMAGRGVAPVAAEPVAALLPARSATTHVQPVPGAVVSPSGRTGRPGRPAPQAKPHLTGFPARCRRSSLCYHAVRLAIR